MSCDHILANEWARCSGKNASSITIFLDESGFGQRSPTFSSPGGGKMRDPGHQVGNEIRQNGGPHVVKSSILTIKQRQDGSNESDQVSVRQIVFNKLSCGERK